MDPNIKPGAIVELADGQVATVRYAGEVSFREGIWIGVELSEATGKNDGAVQGKRYFTCLPKHGMFLQRISKVIEPAPKPAASSGAKVPASSINKRHSTIASMSKPASTATNRASARASMAVSPSKKILPPPVKPAPGRLSIAPRKAPSTEAPKRPTTSSAPSGTPSTVARNQTTASNSKQVEELQTKLRVLEKKRTEDREKLKDLDRLGEEKTRLESIIQKLQAKYQPLGQENIELKKTIKESEHRFESLEALQAEHDADLEMATLDKEMAEEQAEAFKTELDTIRARIEELQLENDILKDENEELGREMDPEERTSKGWLQMERENSRVRDALIRLRDVTQEKEAELQDQVESLQSEVEQLSMVKQEHDETKAKLLAAEADIDDLRQQLEAALGAEDIIEQLTEQNEALIDQIDELKITVEDFESLKEVNDELEINHIETEKQLQDEIDFKESQIADQARRAIQQDEVLADQEYTITKFRDLVTNMQSDLEHLRSTKEITDSEAQQMEEKSREMMDLNRQLQQSAASSKIKTIDMELRKLEAQEAAEHLAIVQLFLPEAFHSERDSVLALLRFKRVAFKATLLHGFVKDKVAGSDKSMHEEDIFDACDVLDKLTYMSSMAERFVNHIYSCSVDQFAKFEGALFDLEPIERSLNSYIELLKKEDLREKQVAEELHRSCAVISHLAEHHLSGGDLAAYTDEILMSTTLILSHLDSTAIAITVLTEGVRVQVPALAEDETEDDLDQFLCKAEQMGSYCRSAKVIVGKAIRALQELKARSLGLNQRSNAQLQQALLAAEDLAEYSRRLGENIFAIIMDESRADQLTFASIRATVLSTASVVFSGISKETTPFAAMGARLDTLTGQLMELAAQAADLDNTAEFERAPAPWVLRSKELAAAKIVSVDAEEEMRKLREEVHSQRRDITARKQELEERDVKVEVLEKRVVDASRRAAQMQDLRDTLAEMKLLVAEKEKQVLAHRERMQKADEERERAMLTAEHYRKLSGESKSTTGPLPELRVRKVRTLEAKLAAMEKNTQYMRATYSRQLRQNDARIQSWLGGTLPPGTNRFLACSNPKTELDHVADVMKFIGLDKAAGWQPKSSVSYFTLSAQESALSEAWSGWDSAVF